VKSGWATATLGDVASIERRGIDPRTLNEDTTYLGLEHIETGGRIISRSTVGESSVSSTKYKFDASHVLFGKLRPYLGKIAAPDFDGVCSTDILPIRPGRALDRGYLLHFLRQPSVVDLAAARATGANLPRLGPSELARFEIPLPPIDEQRRIAAILDHADSIRGKRSSAVLALHSLRTEISDRAVRQPGRLCVLADVAQVTSGLTKGRRVTAPTSTVPYLAVANVQDGHLSLDNLKTIEATQAEIERTRLKAGDLVLTEGGDPDKLGRGTVWRDEIPLCLHQNHIFRVRVMNADLVAPEFLAAAIAGRESKAYFLRSAKRTTGIASINMSQLKALPLKIPGQIAQRVFIKEMDYIDSQRARAEAHAQQLDALFSSLQARAFSGDL
jgi:type I restriction enzyme S subunit